MATKLSEPEIVICAWCRRWWRPIASKTWQPMTGPMDETKASHGICPQCHVEEDDEARKRHGTRTPSVPSLGEALGQGVSGCMKHDTPPGPCRICASELDPENHCAQCGASTIRGLNSDFCSLACEIAFSGSHSFEQLNLVARVP